MVEYAQDEGKLGAEEITKDKELDHFRSIRFLRGPYCRVVPYCGYHDIEEGKNYIRERRERGVKIV